MRRGPSRNVSIDMLQNPFEVVTIKRDAPDLPQDQRLKCNPKLLSFLVIEIRGNLPFLRPGQQHLSNQRKQSNREFLHESHSERISSQDEVTQHDEYLKRQEEMLEQRLLHPNPSKFQTQPSKKRNKVIIVSEGDEEIFHSVVSLNNHQSNEESVKKANKISDHELQLNSRGAFSIKNARVGIQ